MLMSSGAVSCIMRTLSCEPLLLINLTTTGRYTKLGKRHQIYLLFLTWSVKLFLQSSFRFTLVAGFNSTKVIKQHKTAPTRYTRSSSEMDSSPNRKMRSNTHKDGFWLRYGFYSDSDMNLSKNHSLSTTKASPRHFQRNRCGGRRRLRTRLISSVGRRRWSVKNSGSAVSTTKSTRIGRRPRMVRWILQKTTRRVPGAGDAEFWWAVPKRYEKQQSQSVEEFPNLREDDEIHLVLLQLLYHKTVASNYRNETSRIRPGAGFMYKLH